MHVNSIYGKYVSVWGFGDNPYHQTNGIMTTKDGNKSIDLQAMLKVTILWILGKWDT